MSDAAGIKRCYASGYGGPSYGGRSNRKDHPMSPSHGGCAYPSGGGHFDDGAISGSSTSMVEQLFFKANRLIDVGRKRTKCEESGFEQPSVMSKYKDKSEEDSVQKLDSRIEAIIRKYSGSAASDPAHNPKYPVFAITTSPLSFTPTFTEGYGGGMKARCNTIGTLGASVGCTDGGGGGSHDFDKKSERSDKSDSHRKKKSSEGKKSVAASNKTSSGGHRSCSMGCPKPVGYGSCSGNKKNNRSASQNSGHAKQPRHSTTSNKSANRPMSDKPSNDCPCRSEGGTLKGDNSIAKMETPAPPPASAAESEPYKTECGQRPPQQQASPCQALSMDFRSPQQQQQQQQPEPAWESKSTVKKAKSTGSGKKRPRHMLIEEAKNIYKENQLLKLEGMELRQEMECTRKGLMLECAKVLHSVLTFCEEKSKKAKKICRDDDTQKKCVAPCPTSNKGAGCSSGMCGGYTPSGWNKANAHKGAEVTECLPPRTLNPPCPLRGGGEENHQQQEGQDAVVSGVVDCNMCPSVRILGEMTFQLERRILEYVFGAEGKSKRRFYGYTVSNVCYMITKESAVPSGKTDNIGKSDKACRFEKIMSALHKYGYNVKIHPEFAQSIVNKFGVLACPPDQCTIDTFRLQDPCAMSGLISKLCGSPSEVASLNILLRCLSFLSRCDGKPMFVW